MSGLSSSDGGVTLDRHAHPAAGTNATGNVITLEHRGGQRGGQHQHRRDRLVHVRRPHRPSTATIVVADSALSVGETSLVTITFSRRSPLTNADLTVANGTRARCRPPDGGTTWTATRSRRGPTPPPPAT